MTSFLKGVSRYIKHYKRAIQLHDHQASISIYIAGLELSQKLQAFSIRLYGPEKIVFVRYSRTGNSGLCAKDTEMLGERTDWPLQPVLVLDATKDLKGAISSDQE